MMPKTLSKSRFKNALECPRKLVYVTDERYTNVKSNDDLLQALAEGGHQVGALAKHMYPGGIDIDDTETRSIEEKVRVTQDLLQQANVTLFEATFQHGVLVVRVDVLVKRGNDIQLIEVKSKGYNSTKDTFMAKTKKANPINSEWRPYLYDVAFQNLVLKRSHPEWSITPYLMLLDTTVPASIDAVGAQFKILKDGRQVNVMMRQGFDPSTIKPPLIRAHDVTAEVKLLCGYPVDSPAGTHDFEKLVDWLADQITSGNEPPPYAGPQCKKCEFYCEPGEITDKHRSGWGECMEMSFNRKAEWPRTATVFGLYNFRGELTKALNPKQFTLAELQEESLKKEGSETKEAPGVISPIQRNFLQLEEAKGTGDTIYLERNTLRTKFNGWTFPLHFIDFETSRPALPFHIGCKPNEILLFQFSHHILEEDGQLRHASECLIAEPGTHPNAAVVRALRDSLSINSGTVIHWWDHEKTVLKEIRKQLAVSDEQDREELVTFIDTLGGSDVAPGRLADLGRLILNTAFFKDTDGRSSIKKVLPAVVAQSELLMERYGQPVYGTDKMPSLNFERGWTWLRKENGQVRDPYLLLKPVFTDANILQAVAEGESETTGDEKFIANGGAAMVAYGQLQTPDLPSEERIQLETQLKRYCELDTLAMVMVYEAISEWIS